MQKAWDHTQLSLLPVRCMQYRIRGPTAAAARRISTARGGLILPTRTIPGLDLGLIMMQQTGKTHAQTAAMCTHHENALHLANSVKTVANITTSPNVVEARKHARYTQWQRRMKTTMILRAVHLVFTSHMP